LVRRAYAFALLDELIPLYPVYALLFADSGLSTGRISTLLLLWSLTAFVLEVPSGALADRVSRPRLLAVAALLRAAGFALWVAVPSYPGFAAGFVLWGTKSAFTSGAWEALTYDELAAVGAADRYPRVVGRAEVLGTLGLLAGTAAAAPLVAIGGYRLTGWVSVAVCVVGGMVALTLPERRQLLVRAPLTDGGGSAEGRGAGGAGGSAVEDAGAGIRGYVATLRAGLAEARTHPTIRPLLVIAALLPGLAAIDEYLPLLARSTGAGNTLVPVLLVVQYAGLAIGAELAGRYPGVGARRLAVLTSAGAVLLAAGALSGHPVGFLGVGAFYAAVWFGTVVSGTRLQERMTGVARATVTSVAAVGAEAVALAVYAGVGLGSLWAPVPLLVATLVLPLLLLGAMIPRWLPPSLAARVPPAGDSAPATVAGQHQNDAVGEERG
jgi:MFS family permease